MGDINERIRDQVRINRSLGLKGDSWDNYAVALIGTQHEVSGAEDRDSVPLPDTTRDTLLRHARQDAAHALANTTSILSRVRTLTRVLYALSALIVGLGAAVLYLLTKQAGH